MTSVLLKATRETGRCTHGNGKWTKNRWRSVKGPLVPCENGIHYARGEQILDWLDAELWVFEDGSPDETLDAGDKMVTRRGRVVRRVESWNETSARLFAADCAEHVLPLFEDQFDDDRPRKAIKAAWAYARGEIAAAAWAAAWAAAGDAARAAEREWQYTTLLTYIGGELS